MIKLVLFGTALFITLLELLKFDSFPEKIDSSELEKKIANTEKEIARLTKEITNNNVVSYVKDYKKIYNLRYKLIGKLITLQEAIDILVPHDTHSRSNIDYLFTQSRQIYYIYDKTKDQTETYAEYVVFRHKTRNQIAFYKVIPFLQHCAGGYTVVSENDFWKKDFNECLVEGYIKDKASRVIQKGCRNWIFKGQTLDGKVGINCRLSYRDLKNKKGAF
jgi:hypothetical protein